MKRPGYKYVLAFLDWVVINAAFVITPAILSVIYPKALFFTSITPYEWAFFAVYGFAAVAVFQQNNLYKINVFLTRADQTVRLGISVFYVLIGLVVVSFFSKSTLVTGSRAFLLCVGGILLLLEVFFRVIVFRSLFLILARTKVYGRRTLIVGAGQIGKFLATYLKVSNRYGVRLVGFLDDGLDVGTPVAQGLKVLGKIEDGPSLVRQNRISEVIITSDNPSYDRFFETLYLFSKTRAQVKVASPLLGIVPEKLFTEKYGEIALTPAGSMPDNSIYLITKRMFDIVFSFLGLVLLSPLFLVIAAVIRFDSPGRIFHHQTRIGKDGKPFRFYKFRSMLVGSENDNARPQKLAAFIKSKSKSNGSTKIVDDNRVTRVGRLIRKTSLDELPQLFNVLRGDMSLVGPRPCLPYELDHYEPWHRRRLSVIPGCTGVWQVNARSEVTFEEMVILDLYYINNASLFLDLVLILKTLPVMIFGKGAK